MRAVTQADTVKACGINYYTFRGWIHKKIFPPLQDAYKLSLYLEVSIEFLMSEKLADKKLLSNKRYLTLNKKKIA